MSYTKTIPPSELSLYATFPDWNAYYQKAITNLQILKPGHPLSEATLKVENIIFDNDAIFDTDIDCGVEFKNCFFKGNITFYKGKFKRRISFAQCFCDVEFDINNDVEFQEQFDIIQLKVKKQLLIRGGTFSESRWSLLDEATVKISGGNFKQLILGYWGGAQLEYFSLTANRTKGQIDIVGQKTKINNFLLNGSSVDLSFTIFDVEVNTFTITHFKKSNRFRVDKVKPITGTGEKTVFSINESFLGSSEFNSIDFNRYDELHIFESQLTECSWTNIKWKERIFALKSPNVYRTDEENEWAELVMKFDNSVSNDYYKLREWRESQLAREYFFRKREILRQLKFSSGKQGDVVNEQIFHALEMIAYDSALNWHWHNISTKLIIKFSRYFSNFGQSFIIPLVALALGHFLLVFSLIWFQKYDDLYISLCNANWNGFRLALYQYFYLINPLRKPDESFSGYFILLDVLMRIWSSYMIYNMIRSSRRFIK